MPQFTAVKRRNTSCTCIIMLLHTSIFTEALIKLISEFVPLCSSGHSQDFVKGVFTHVIHSHMQCVQWGLYSTEVALLSFNNSLPPKQPVES